MSSMTEVVWRPTLDLRQLSGRTLRPAVPNPRISAWPCVD